VVVGGYFTLDAVFVMLRRLILSFSAWIYRSLRFQFARTLPGI
jgi:hypothetical protein